MGSRGFLMDDCGHRPLIYAKNWPDPYRLGITDCMRWCGLCVPFDVRLEAERKKKMSMNSYVYGYRPPDGQWKKMKAVWDACQKAGVTPPCIVEEFFDYVAPDPAGAKVEIKDAVSKYTEEMVDGFEVDITKLPPGIKIIRFINSY